MRQRLLILITVAVVLVVLVALNAASYMRVERTEDAEWNPDRSTYNSGRTGTRALYDFLSESGYQVMRWREPPSALLSNRKTNPKTFVVIGKTVVQFNAEQAETLLRWVEQGGRLLIIDRRPDARLLTPSGDWSVTTRLLQSPSADAQPENPEELTANVKPVSPAQPTNLTRRVETVMPSRLASLIEISYTARKKGAAKTSGNKNTNAGTDEDSTIEDTSNENTSHESTSHEEASNENSGEDTVTEDEPPPPVIVRVPSPSPAPANNGTSKTAITAPVVHLENGRGAMLIDYPHGDGRIIVLSDPFIVANNGLNRADNLQLALNLLTNGAGPAGGLIAFDEYHQGRSTTENELFAYFAGTPLLPMLAQGALVVLALIWTRGRRFARPLPLPHVDRRSKLEFVASMAELQQQARAYDLAIENVYTRLRRVLARFAGVDHNSPRGTIAAGVAARSNLDRKELEALMRECEDAINGEPLGARKALELVAQLRRVERTLGLRMRSREVRQAKEK